MRARIMLSAVTSCPVRINSTSETAYFQEANMISIRSNHLCTAAGSCARAPAVTPFCKPIQQRTHSIRTASFAFKKAFRNHTRTAASCVSVKSSDGTGETGQQKLEELVNQLMESINHASRADVSTVASAIAEITSVAHQHGEMSRRLMLGGLYLVPMPFATSLCALQAEPPE